MARRRFRHRGRKVPLPRAKTKGNAVWSGRRSFWLLLLVTVVITWHQGRQLKSYFSLARSPTFTMDKNQTSGLSTNELSPANSNSNHPLGDSISTSPSKTDDASTFKSTLGTATINRTEETVSQSKLASGSLGVNATTYRADEMLSDPETSNGTLGQPTSLNVTQNGTDRVVLSSIRSNGTLGQPTSFNATNNRTEKMRRSRTQEIISVPIVSNGTLGQPASANVTKNRTDEQVSAPQPAPVDAKNRSIDGTVLRPKRLNGTLSTNVTSNSTDRVFSDHHLNLTPAKESSSSETPVNGTLGRPLSANVTSNESNWTESSRKHANGTSRLPILYNVTSNRTAPKHTRSTLGTRKSINATSNTSQSTLSTSMPPNSTSGIPNSINATLNRTDWMVQATNHSKNVSGLLSTNSTFVNRTDWKSRVRFFVLGVQKGGSTSVYTYMMKHPYIITSRKEKKCFSWQYDPKDPYCERYIDIPKLMENENFITGDFTPDYFWQSESVIPRILETYPEARFIVVLRQPIRRAFSQYKMKVDRYHTWNDTFEEYAMAELEQIRKCGVLSHWDFENNTNSPTIEDYQTANIDWKAFKKWFGTPDMVKAWKCTFEENTSKGLIKQGLYAISLARWFYSFPKERFLVLKNEEMEWHTQREVDRIFQHLDLDPVQVEDSGKANRGNYSAIDVDNSTLEALKKLYRPFTEKLRYLLRHDPIWEKLWDDDDLS